MQQAFAGDIADLDNLDQIERAPSGQKPVDVLGWRTHVLTGLLVPQSVVSAEVTVHELLLPGHHKPRFCRSSSPMYLYSPSVWWAISIMAASPSV